MHLGPDSLDLGLEHQSSPHGGWAQVDPGIDLSRDETLAPLRHFLVSCSRTGDRVMDAPGWRRNVGGPQVLSRFALAGIVGCIAASVAGCTSKDHGHPPLGQFMQFMETVPGHGCEFVDISGKCDLTFLRGDTREFTCDDAEAETATALFSEAKRARYAASSIDRDTLPLAEPDPDTIPFPSSDYHPCFYTDTTELPNRHWVEVTWKPPGSYNFENYTFPGCGSGEEGQLIAFVRGLWDKYYWEGERPGPPPCPESPPGTAGAAGAGGGGPGAGP